MNPTPTRTTPEAIRYRCRRCKLTTTFTDPKDLARAPIDGCPGSPSNTGLPCDYERMDPSPAKSIVRLNAEKDPNYNPYCGPCPGLVRMRKVEPFLWRCRCGAVHDERRPEDAGSS